MIHRQPEFVFQILQKSQPGAPQNFQLLGLTGGGLGGGGRLWGGGGALPTDRAQCITPEHPSI